MEVLLPHHVIYVHFKTMITDIKNNIIDLTNQLQSEKNNEVWDMEEVFYLDTSIRNSITSLIDYCRGINTGSAPDGFGLAMSSLTEEEWTLVNSTLIHEPLPDRRPLAAWEYGYISGSNI